jgi:glycosyltransferase involved in cell wall biosynthesis
MASGEPTIDVLMATYNGARFVDQQIESIFAQPGRPLRLVVRDDGSTDGTPAILARQAAQRAGRIEIVENGGHRLGARDSFAELLEHSTADYVMFADQDDVWQPGRTAKMLRRMEQVEAESGRKTPILVHTDLAVVDSQLRPIHPSFFRYERLEPRRGSALNRLLVQNVVTGCASLINRALARCAAPIPAEAVMHDWWLGLVAAALGRVECLPEATVLYRQHGRNRIGAKRWGARYVLLGALSLVGRRGFSGRLEQTQRQATALLDRFGPDLTPAKRTLLAAYGSLAAQNAFQRRVLLVRYGFYKSGWIRNLGLFAGV